MTEMSQRKKKQFGTRALSFGRLFSLI